nr:hypothetical protein [Tanacetum cinerariifolium]
KSIAKAKKESSDEECSTFGSEDEEYAMATFQRIHDDKNDNSDRKCFRCGDLNHLIGECPKPPKDKNQRAFVGGSWSDRGEKDDENVKDETCLVAHASSELFSTYKAYNIGNIIFGSNLRGNIIGKGQICDNKCRVTFFEHDSEITKDGKVIGRGHANMHLIQSLASKELVRNLPKLKFDQHFCEACKIEKQAHASHKAKNVVSTTRCLKLLHMDFFHQFAVWSYEGNRYTLVIVDDYSSSFLYGFINEEVYVAQPLRFIDFEKPDHVYKLKKALYGLKQAPKAEDGIFFNQSKYIKEMLKKFGLEDSKPMKTSMSSDTKLTKDKECELVDSTKYRGMIGLWYPKETGIETVVYADSDHAGDYVDRKSTSGICTYVGCCLTSWFLKKQIALVISTTEAEYSENLERIMAREEVGILLPHPPSMNHLHLISTMMMMMMEIIKGPRVHLNPQPLQSHPSLDITLSLSPITPFDHIHETPSPPSPPSPPQPQPPIMGHPLFYNYHDYYGSTFISNNFRKTNPLVPHNEGELTSRGSLDIVDFFLPSTTRRSFFLNSTKKGRNGT